MGTGVARAWQRVGRSEIVLSIALALGAGLSWGVSDFLGGLKSRRLALLSVLLISQGISVLPIAAVVLVRAEAPPGTSFVVWSVAASLTGLLGLASFYRAMALGTMGVVAPISASGAMLPVVVGLALGEPSTPPQLLGVALALAGVALVSRATVDASAVGVRSRASVGFALLAALGFGTFFLALHAAGQADVWWAVLVQRVTSVGILVLASLRMRPSLAVGWGHAGGLAMVGVLDVSANALYTAASTLGLASFAAVLASLYPVVTILLARLVLRERMSPLQHAGVASALAGVALISAR